MPGCNVSRRFPAGAQPTICCPASGSRITCRYHALVVMDQYPADRSEADDNSYRNRPGADADRADGLPLRLVFGDLAVARLLLLRIAHPRPPDPFVKLGRSTPQPNLPYATAT